VGSDLGRRELLLRLMDRGLAPGLWDALMLPLTSAALLLRLLLLAT
jgi:hypothetical protein